jgi:phospholipid-binding lipoprotein MlaA
MNSPIIYPPRIYTKPAHSVLVALALTFTSSIAMAAEHAPDSVMQIELPQTLVDAVPANDDFTAISLQEENDAGSPITKIDDPWESVNRSIYGFNMKADKYVLKPIATAYDKVTPEPVQQGVRNFFSNLKSPATLVNELLQGRPMDSAETLGRFAVNTTVGVVGIFDPASSIGLARRNEDFGQTFAVWGWENSNYVVLPLLGPRTLRDTAGFVGDSAISPLSQVGSDGVVIGLKSLEITDKRKQMLPLDDVRANAIDEYVMMRDAWAQGRQHEIREGTEVQANAGDSLLQRFFQ